MKQEKVVVDLEVQATWTYPSLNEDSKNILFQIKIHFV